MRKSKVDGGAAVDVSIQYDGECGGCLDGGKCIYLYVIYNIYVYIYICTCRQNVAA